MRARGGKDERREGDLNGVEGAAVRAGGRVGAKRACRAVRACTGSAHARALCNARTDLVDNCHLKVADENAVRECTVRLHGPDIVIVVALAVVRDSELILVDLDEMRGLA